MSGNHELDHNSESLTNGGSISWGQQDAVEEMPNGGAVFLSEQTPEEVEQQLNKLEQLVEQQEQLMQQQAYIMQQREQIKQLSEQIEQLTSQPTDSEMANVLDAVDAFIASCGIMNTPRGVAGEDEGLDDIIASLGQEGTTSAQQFVVGGRLADIDTAIEKLGQAFELCHDGHPKKPDLLNNLGSSYQMRFERLGDLADLAKAIDCLVNLVHLTADGHPNKPMYLSNLGNVHRARFERLEEMVDINQAIENQVSAVELTPDGHSDKPGYLSNLGVSHLTRFHRLGQMAEINKAIEYLLSAVQLTLDDHPDKPMYLSNLGNSHCSRFKRLREMVDINKAVEYQVSAIQLTPDGHPDKPGRLNNLGNIHWTRFECLGEMADVNKAAECQVSAVQLTPEGHPNKPISLSNLGVFHITRFQRLGEMADIEKAIESLRTAVQLTPDGHPSMPLHLSNLGSSYQRRFERLGEMADIDKAVEYQVGAANLTPDGRPDKPRRLNNLGSSYQLRFERLGEIPDVDKAIESLRSAIRLTPEGHPDKPPRLNNLGNAHQMRFERLGDTADIEKAIECQVNAVRLSTDGQPIKPGHLSNLGSSYQIRFERLREEADINKAIEHQVHAVQLTPDDHPDKPMYLSNLGNAHRFRFEELGEIVDFDKAIECLIRAVQLTPDGHPQKPKYHFNLGIPYLLRFERLRDMADVDNAIKHFKQSASSITGPAIIRFQAARAWTNALHQKEAIAPNHSRDLYPQQTLINLLPELVWLGATIHQRFQTIQEVVGSSIHDAVSAAIRSQELELAVEWIEQGRSIVWSQLRRLRSPLLDLQEAHPSLAHRFQDLQQKIESSFLRRDMNGDADDAESATITPISLEQQAQAHRYDVKKREDLLTEIRRQAGFETFLLPEKFPVLSKACQGHLVVLLTVAGEQCDALIVSPSSSISHLSLADASLDDIRDLHVQWDNSRNAQLKNRGDERGDKPAALEMEPMIEMLSDLWDKIIHPIVEEAENLLRDSTEDRMARIIWCPAGPLSFLPLHAAGIYGSDSTVRIGISDFAVSSYTPSLMALQSNHPQLGRPSILMVTQPNTPNQASLPGTLREAEKIIQKAALNDVELCVHHLSESQATVSTVIERLQSHGWLHLACHGIQEFPDPMESSFALHDGSLTLATLMRKSMGHAQFAFLSACQTATGNESLPDEAMHLTSGMLAAGFPSVVGTMWSIGDSVAPEVAEAFYAILFEEGRKSGWKERPEPAYALHFALKKLRDETTGDNDLTKWVPFVHFGI
ncbi:CHAT domain-containing protein [Flagelloscypha sp. PMI_526]|nr:CHAT domain-containing protein [Flagelloscypha sp. PMI_526]